MINSEKLTTDVLRQPVAALSSDPYWREQCRLMGFTTLKDITDLTPAELIQTSGFTYQWLGQLAAFLSEKAQLHLLQPIPGNTAG